MNYFHIKQEKNELFSIIIEYFSMVILKQLLINNLTL